MYRKTLMINKVSVTELSLFSPDLISLNCKMIPMENNRSFKIKTWKLIRFNVLYQSFPLLSYHIHHNLQTLTVFIVLVYQIGKCFANRMSNNSFNVLSNIKLLSFGKFIKNIWWNNFFYKGCLKVIQHILKV